MPKLAAITMGLLKIGIIFFALVGCVQGLDYGCRCGKADRGEIKAFRHLKIDTDFRQVTLSVFCAAVVLKLMFDIPLN